MEHFVKKISIPELGLEIFPDIRITVEKPGPSFIYHEPKYFYHKIVKQNLKEFYADEGDERKAINACITLYHVLDWFCKTKQEKKDLCKEIPYNDALESIANGTKHFNLDKPYRTGRKTGTNVPRKLIVIKDEKETELSTILKAIEEFWDNKLGKHYLAMYAENEELFD